MAGFFFISVDPDYVAVLLEYSRAWELPRIGRSAAPGSRDCHAHCLYPLLNFNNTKLLRRHPPFKLHIVGCIFQLNVVQQNAAAILAA